MRRSSSTAATPRSPLLTAPDAPAIDAVMLDLVMPGLDGMGVLAKIREAGLSVPVIVQTAHGGIDNVVSAMRAGAPGFRRQAGRHRAAPGLAAQRAQRLRAQGRIAAHPAQPRGPADLRRHHHPQRGDGGRDAAAQKAAGSSIPVLIEGESGVGKEMFARAIHGSGERKAKPFVAVNCGAIPDNLVESILFGHEKGAFTGATERHTGKFVEASWRHAVPGRGQRAAADRAGQAAARASGRRGRSGRRPQAGEGRRPDHLGDQPQAARAGQRRAISAKICSIASTCCR